MVVIVATVITISAVNTAYAADNTGNGAVRDITRVAQNLSAQEQLKTLHASDKYAPKEAINVCAVPQLYQALLEMQKHSPVKFNVRFGTENELSALIANASSENMSYMCDVLLSADERLPISAVRMQKALASSLVPFTRAPLILWSADANLLRGHDPRELFAQQKIKSLAVAARDKTPVGFATYQAVNRQDMQVGYLKDKTYRSDHEYQVYSMVASSNVQCGFISEPLIISVRQEIPGSYWEVPRSYHADIQYYGVLMSASVSNKKAQDFLRYLVENPNAQKLLDAFGFAPLKSRI